MPRHAHEFRAVTRRAADTRLTSSRLPPRSAVFDDQADARERLHIVNDGRPAEETTDCGEGWLNARPAPLSFDRFEQRSLFTADIGAGASM